LSRPIFRFCRSARVLQAWRFDPKALANLMYYSVPAATRFEYAMLYLGLAVLLGIMTHNVHEMLSGPR
jgi:hypothetical protein